MNDINDIKDRREELETFCYKYMPDLGSGILLFKSRTELFVNKFCKL